MGVDFFEQEQKIVPVIAAAATPSTGLIGRVIASGLASNPRSASYFLLFVAVIAFAGMGALLVMSVSKKAELTKEERMRIERSL